MKTIIDNSLIQSNPQDKVTYLFLIKTLLQLGKNEEAAQALARAQLEKVDISEFIEAMVIEALILIENGDYKQAHVKLSQGSKSRQASSSFFHFLAK